MIIKCEPNRVARTYLGGHRIDRLRGIEADDGFMPEEWIASVTSARNAGSADPNEGLSYTESGETLLSVLTENPDYLGKYDKLPILLKLLDASERLVIQAHPTVEFAEKHLNSSFGKAECWYIISADKGAHVYLGFREGVTREEWVKAFEAQDVNKMLSMLHRIDLAPGDVWYVDGGVPHAIGGGCLMAELQEPTDLMVVPERVTPSGRKLAEERLHCGLGFEKMFDVFDYKGYSRAELETAFFRHKSAERNKCCQVIDKTLTDKFSMAEYSVDGVCDLSICGNTVPSVAIVIEGSGELSDSDGNIAVKAGDGLFIPANAEAVRAVGNMRILVATP